MSLRLLPALLLVLTATVPLYSPTPAHGHAIESSLERLSNLTDQLLLDSRFSNGEPAADAVVRLLPPGGEPIELGRTDASGQLRFSLPQNAAFNWEVQVDQGPGHRDYLELPASFTSTTGQGAASISKSNSSARVPGPIAPGLAPMLVGLSAIGGVVLLRRRRWEGRRGTPRR